MWLGGGSDVFSDLVPTFWQKLRESGFQHDLLQTNDCTQNSRKNAIVLRPLRAIVSREQLHELFRQQTTIAATPLAESTPSPNSQNLKKFQQFPRVTRIGALPSENPADPRRAPHETPQNQEIRTEALRTL